VKRGEIVAVVGESGAGKSLLAHAILGLLPVNATLSGTMHYDGTALTLERIKRLRGREIALIPQSVAFLNPLWRVGGQVARAAYLGGRNSRQAVAARDRAFQRYRLSAGVKAMFPYQISGGMARRVLTAAATVGEARLIVADEPTSGMDTQNSCTALASLRNLADNGKGVLLITHDIDVAVAFSDRVAVFRHGVTVEMAAAGDFKAAAGLRHPYTRQLYSALPGCAFTQAVNGSGPAQPSESGCVNCGNCSRESEICMLSAPPRIDLGQGWVRCHHA
jgi:peptide/nickel transport system ATP-binding protein